MEQPYIRDDGLSPALARILGLPLEQWERESNIEQNVRTITDWSAEAIECSSCNEDGEQCLGCAREWEVSHAYFEGVRELVDIGVFDTIQEATSMAFPDAALKVCPVDAARQMHPADLDRLRPSLQLTRGQKIAVLFRKMRR
jgi:hypothetical protein